MARPHEAEDSEEEEASEHAKVKPRIVKKRKEVTTASILESFLLLATSLDDTVRQDAVAHALGEAPESSSSTKGAQGSSKNENKTCVSFAIASAYQVAESRLLNVNAALKCRRDS